MLIALLVAIGAARRLPLGFAGQAQIPVSVLLTVALGPATPGYGHWRVVDTVIGGVVGILVGVGIPERPSFGPARQAQSVWGTALAAQLEAIAGELEAGEKTITDHGRHDFIASSRALAATVTAGEAAASMVEEALHFNPRGRKGRDELDLLRRRGQELARMTLQVRALSLTIDQMYDRVSVAPRLERLPLAALVRGTAELFRDRRNGVDILATSLALRAEIAQAVQSVTADETDAYVVLDSVSLLGRVEQLRQEITVDTTLGLRPDTAGPPAG